MDVPLDAITVEECADAICQRASQVEQSEREWKQRWNRLFEVRQL